MSRRAGKFAIASERWSCNGVVGSGMDTICKNARTVDKIRKVPNRKPPRLLSGGLLLLSN